MRSSFSSLLATFVFISVACDGSPVRPGGPRPDASLQQLDDVVRTALTRCGLITGDGAIRRRLSPFNGAPSVLPEMRACALDCVRETAKDCSAFATFACGDAPLPALSACLDACKDLDIPCQAIDVSYTPGTSCSSGSACYNQSRGGTFKPSMHCDALANCVDGTDEQGCYSVFWRCDDGTPPTVVGSGDEAARRRLLCDGKADCRDGSDELGCDGQATLCNDGSTRPLAARCDGREDCPSGEDERDCKPTDTALPCPALRPVPAVMRCDGRAQCPDGSDELVGCAHLACGSGFVCSNGEAITPSADCDGVSDCSDGGDEAIAHCFPELLEACATGTIRYSAAQRCDGHIECVDDLSDERDCPGACTLLGEVAIGGPSRCDGVRDCPDGLDEAPELCTNVDLPFACGDDQRLAMRRVCDGHADCSDGSDEQCGVTPTPTPVPPDFSCDDGARTIPRAQVCDGAANCVDASDERSCTSRLYCDDGTSIPRLQQCNGPADCANGKDEEGCPGRFQCTNRSSVPSGKRCDRTADCADGSDEKTCLFACTSGKGGGIDERCDGVLSCSDGSDEAGCGTTPSQFRCQQGQLIPLTSMCDQFRDCADSADEYGCASSGFQCADIVHFVPSSQRCDGRADCPDSSDETGCP
jgi:Low-density lipoprotein receptor domain class A